MRKDTGYNLDEFINLLKISDDETDILHLLREIFTESELATISKRWEILEMLRNNVPQRAIADKLGVSLCKVTRGSKIIKNKENVVTKYLAAK